MFSVGLRVGVLLCGFSGKALGSAWFPLSSSRHVTSGLIGAGSPFGGRMALTSGSFNAALHRALYWPSCVPFVTFN